MSTAYALYRHGVLSRAECISRLLEHYETVTTQLADLEALKAQILVELAALQSDPIYDTAALDALAEALTQEGFLPFAARIRECKRSPGEGEVIS